MLMITTSRWSDGVPQATLDAQPPQLRKALHPDYRSSGTGGVVVGMGTCMHVCCGGGGEEGSDWVWGAEEGSDWVWGPSHRGLVSTQAVAHQAEAEALQRQAHWPCNPCDSSASGPLEAISADVCGGPNGRSYRLISVTIAALQMTHQITPVSVKFDSNFPFPEAAMTCSHISISGQ